MSRGYRHSLRIRYLECDPQGVLAYPRYLGLFDVAMTEMWREAVGPYQQSVDAGTDLVVAETTIRYRAPARFDELLDIDVSVQRLGTTSLTLAFRSSVEGEARADGEIRYVCVQTGSHRPTPLPENVRHGLRPLQAVA